MNAVFYVILPRAMLFPFVEEYSNGDFLTLIIPNLIVFEDLVTWLPKNSEQRYHGIMLNIKYIL